MHSCNKTAKTTNVKKAKLKIRTKSSWNKSSNLRINQVFFLQTKRDPPTPPGLRNNSNSRRLPSDNRDWPRNRKLSNSSKLTSKNPRGLINTSKASNRCLQLRILFNLPLLYLQGINLLWPNLQSLRSILQGMFQTLSQPCNLNIPQHLMKNWLSQVPDRWNWSIIFFIMRLFKLNSIFLTLSWPIYWV